MRLPPTVHAGGYTARTVPDVFVPPNDQRPSSVAETYLKVMPAWRSQYARQPRRFPVASLDDPVMELIWAEDPPGETAEALAALARDVSYIGHSTSLTRCRFAGRAAPATPHVPMPARRWVYRGRLQELEREFAPVPGATGHPARCFGPGTAARYPPADPHVPPIGWFWKWSVAMCQTSVLQR